MKLKDYEVIEYFLNENNNITGHALHNKKRKPEFTNNPLPPDFEYEDEFGNYKYKLEREKIILNSLGPSTAQLELREFRKKDLLEILK